MRVGIRYLPRMPAVSDDLEARLLAAIEAIPLIDPHTHIDPVAPASSTLADILGYHYYTELAHSAGLPKDQIDPHGDGTGIEPREKVRRLVPYLGKLRNTAQVAWLNEICREFYGLGEEIPGDRLDESNWEAVYDRAEQVMALPDYEDRVLGHSGLEAVFLTNDFDDPLEGFDTSRYIPCLRTDDLVFKLGEPAVRARLEKASGVTLSDAASLREAIGTLFQKFVAKNAKACAISLPPEFTPEPASDAEIDAQIQTALEHGEFEWDELNSWVIFELASRCREHGLPFDLMVGVTRGVYEGGVHQGRDLYNRVVSLEQYRELFNAFPEVTFPVSVLDHTANAELVSFAWIFPNVVASGHWWYQNLPGYIEQDLRVRLEGVPSTKIVGYYSDMYKLEFALPKFRMFRRMLARVLAREYVAGQGWGEDEAITLARQILRGNVEQIFGV